MGDHQPAGPLPCPCRAGTAGPDREPGAHHHQGSGRADIRRGRPDGALYVGLLRGIPSDPGTAYIYRVVPGQQPTIWARGLTAVTAIAFDSQGRLLATEYSTGGLLAPPTVPGALVRISPNGQTVTILPVPGLYQPTGVAVGSGGAVYVSNYGASTATASHPGELLKITGLS